MASGRTTLSSHSRMLTSPLSTEAERAAGPRPDTPAPLSGPGLGKINIVRTARNMRRHEISSAGADESGRPRSAAAADASVPHAPEHAVKFDGMKSNRNTAGASVAAAGTAHNNRDAGTAFPKNLPKNPHRAGPRARRPPPPSRLARQLRPPDASAAVPGNAGSARTAAAAPAALTDSAAPHANAATAGPHPDRTGCNTDSADGTAGMASHIPSAGRHANTCLGGVEVDCRIGHTQTGPRE